MTSPDSIRAAFVAKLKAIPSLVTLLGNNANNIVEYVEETGGDSFGTIQKLIMNPPPKLLVMYQGHTPRTGRELHQHNFSVIIRASVSPGTIFKEFVDGAVTGATGPGKMLYEPILGSHPMEVPSLNRRTVPTSDQSSFDYWEITTSFVEM